MYTKHYFKKTTVVELTDEKLTLFESIFKDVNASLEVVSRPTPFSGDLFLKNINTRIPVTPGMISNVKERLNKKEALESDSYSSFPLYELDITYNSKSFLNNKIVFAGDLQLDEEFIIPGVYLIRPRDHFDEKPPEGATEMVIPITSKLKYENCNRIYTKLFPYVYRITFVYADRDYPAEDFNYSSFPMLLYGYLVGDVNQLFLQCDVDANHEGEESLKHYNIEYEGV